MRFPWLVLHITGGIIGLLSGSIAMVYAKARAAIVRLGTFL